MDQIDNRREDPLAPLVCIKCGTEVFTEAEPWPEACPSCRWPFDLKAQFAYIRGLDAFSAGQELIIHIPPRKRERNLTTEAEMEGLQDYIQAYTALQESFKGEIAESQRQFAIEMMAAMARVFMQHGMVSPLEAAYWGNLLVELNSQRERASLLQKLAAQARGGVPGFFRRWHWRTRLKQLETALVEMDEKILRLELNIAFIDPPRARRGKEMRLSERG
jgi:hypothetical protein